MDFSTLVTPYCSSEALQTFIDGLNNKAVSSFLINPKFLTESSKAVLDSLGKADENDSLLHRFDKEEERLGKTLLHMAGAFYILDPSSAVISYYLAPMLPKDPLVLDLCAAPGGKSIALSFRRPDALIVSNDIAYNRALEIAKNTDRLGLGNIVSVSGDPQTWSLGQIADSILLDVPCSGSGMIRKEPKMAEDWSVEKMNRLLPTQRALLEKSWSMLKGDGILAYSTCSLSLEEDEDQIEAFLKKHPEAEEILVEVPKDILRGKYGYHLVPGVYQGEGIYFALLRKKEGGMCSLKPAKDFRSSDIPGYGLFGYRRNFFYVTRMYQELSKLNFIVPGIKKFDDSPHPKCPFDHAYGKIARDLTSVELEKEKALAYVKGEEVAVSNVPDGLCVLTYLGCRLGLGKVVKGKVKNYLPKGLRANLLD